MLGPAIDAAVQEFGRIDGLVNNAAYYTAIVKRPFEEIDDDEWDKVFDVNVRGAWLTARAARLPPAESPPTAIRAGSAPSSAA